MNTEGLKEALVGVLKTGSAKAKQSAAGVIYNLAFAKENKIPLRETPGLMDSLKAMQHGSAEEKAAADEAIANLK